ncbi:aldehyde dehydrogenase family protein [Streptomyces sp. NPDC002285]
MIDELDDIQCAQADEQPCGPACPSWPHPVTSPLGPAPGDQVVDSPPPPRSTGPVPSSVPRPAVPHPPARWWVERYVPRVPGDHGRDFRRRGGVVRRANDVPLGLPASVWTENARLSHDIPARLDFGTVWVNSSGTGRRGPLGRLQGLRLGGFVWISWSLVRVCR